MAIEHTFIHKGGFTKTKKLTPLKAIREKCMECSNWQYSEITSCPCTDCALYVFRSGRSGQKRPSSKGGFQPKIVKT